MSLRGFDGGNRVEGLALKLKVSTQIKATDLRIGGHELCGSLTQDTPFKEKGGFVGDGEGLLHIVVRNQDTDIAALQGINDMLNILDRNRVDTGKRLIQQDEGRVGGKCPGHLRTAALTSG